MQAPLDRPPTVVWEGTSSPCWQGVSLSCCGQGPSPRTWRLLLWGGCRARAVCLALELLPSLQADKLMLREIRFWGDLPRGAGRRRLGSALGASGRRAVGGAAALGPGPWLLGLRSQAVPCRCLPGEVALSEGCLHAGRGQSRRGWPGPGRPPEVCSPACAAGDCPEARRAAPHCPPRGCPAWRAGAGGRLRRDPPGGSR